MDADIVEVTKNDATPVYDLILGTKTMKELGVILNFQDKTITMDDVILPMHTSLNLSKHQMVKDIKRFYYTLSPEPISTAVTTKHVVEILDAKYEKADLPAICKALIHLTKDQQEQLLTLLQKYEELFDGTLGEWKTTPVSLELKEGAKPYNIRQPYPVQRCTREP